VRPCGGHIAFAKAAWRSCTSGASGWGALSVSMSILFCAATHSA